MKLGDYDLHDLMKYVHRPKDRLGVAVDEGSVRLVRMKGSIETGFRIENFAELDIDIRNAEPLEQQRFRSAVRQVGGGLTRAAMNIEHPTLRIRKMVFARMPERDLMEAIRWNFREHIELPIEQYSVGYTVLYDDEEEGRMEVMAYGLAESAIVESIAFMKSLGLKLVSLEPTSTALLTAFYVNGVLNDGGYHVCIAFGDNVTHFIVMKDESLLFSRPLAGVNREALIKLIMRNLNLKDSAAAKALDNWVENSDVETSSEEGVDDKMHRIGMTTTHFFSQMVIEVQRSIDAFCIMYRVDRVDGIHVCGSGVYFPGLIEHLGRSLGVETKAFDPLQKLMRESGFTEEIARSAPLFSVAVGLAIP
jgi:type IV pilus assembly protein PilM